ncbi:sterol desaturase family protein [Caulobacter sp. DWR1-3-2b1]|uniref:sterol desaturase family protein n=1 Tax=Caulobacter sp. DWR1-3-2b1 TaxID=2804670 RepID=UPI003CF96A3D
MATLAFHLALFLAAFAFMEAFAWVTHRYVMHGFMWVWHKSHHEPREGAFELNDLFAVVFAAPAIVAIYFGANGTPWLLPVGLGITAYGFVYFIFHDGMVHRRFKTPFGKSAFWKRAIQAHRIHHAVHTKEGAVSFGFLVARPVRVLKAQLKARGGEA